LLGEEVAPQGVQFFNKPPHIGTMTPPHQDGFYFCLVPNEATTVWIALDDIDSENGALHYWKGSHTKGVLDHTASHVLGFSQGLASSPKNNLEGETICHVDRGGCLIHHSLMVHAAGPNRSERPRRALGLVYYGRSAQLDAEAYRRYQESVAEQQSKINRSV
jgi:phytanoyl-CoA hydroxylase